MNSETYRRLMCALVTAILLLPAGCKKKSSSRDTLEQPETKKWLDDRLKKILGEKVAPSAWRSGVSLPFRFKYAGGNIDFGVTVKDKVRHIKLAFNSISLAQLTGQGGKTGLPLKGTVEGSGKISKGPGGVSGVTGELAFRCNQCAIGGTRVQIKPIRPGGPPLHGGVGIPTLRLGKMGCRIVIAHGRAAFKDCKARSDDLELVLSGSVRLRDPFRFSTMDGYLTFRLTDDVKRREPKWVALEVVLTRGRRDDGFFGFSIRGRLSELRVRPSRR